MTSTTRSPLSEPGLQAAVLTGSRLFRSVQVVPRTGSTNADLLAAARSGAPEGAVLVAEEQTSGRGRLDRSWHSQPGAALTFSVLVRPAAVPAASRGWLPLLTGVAVAAALRAGSGLDISLKWPNDVLCGAAKLAGILAEQASGAVVVGIGLNVSATRDELPAGQATSLTLQGAADPDRQGLLVAILREFEYWYLRWAQGAPPGDVASSGLRAEYLRCCGTVGRDVRVELPGGSLLAGRAGGVDHLGRLLVSAGGRVQAVSAGDVVHVRPQV
jgi:BirA family transcriptional regulator, biotin operon repressor / biotin---[acetyl-CoA-carboxylase] ligase